MLETQPTSTVGTLGKTAINDGYALSYNSKGRGNSAVALFDQTISLGPEVGDQVKVSFDFRVWRDSPNANTFEQPDDAELRFGLFQDTDNQLGLTNPVAGPDVAGVKTGAVWGQDDGYFDGTRGSLPGYGQQHRQRRRSRLVGESRDRESQWPIPSYCSQWRWVADRRRNECCRFRC